MRLFVCVIPFLSMLPVCVGQSTPSEGYAERVAALERAHQADPKDASVLDALAGSYAMDGHYGPAIDAVLQLIALRPEDSTLGLRLAKLLAWNGQAEESLQQLQKINVSNDAEAAQFKCEVLTTLKRAQDAAGCYAAVLTSTPRGTPHSQVALLGLARNQLWSGDLSAAARNYEEYTRTVKGDRSATLEFIRLLRYRGAYAKAETLCNQLLEDRPDDPEVLALRSQVLFWSGNRKREARENAEHAVELAPNLEEARVARIAALLALGENNTARGQLRVLREEQSTPATAAAGKKPETDPASYFAGRLSEETAIRAVIPYSVYNDSDGIHDSTGSVSFEIPIRGDHTLNTTVSESFSSAPTGIFTDGRNRTSIREFSTGGTLLIAPGLHLSLLGGGSTMSSVGSLRPTYKVGVTGWLKDRWSLTLGSSREFLKVTPRAIDRGISSEDVFAEVRYWLNSRTSASWKFDRTWWSDHNRGMQADAVLSRNFIYKRHFNLDSGALVGYQLFDKNMEAPSGFFTPDRYSRYNGFADVHGEMTKRVSWEFRGETGTQQILSSADYKPNWDVTARLSLKLNKAVRLYGSYSRRNYSLFAGNGWYQGFYVSLNFQSIGGI
jgi:tetratricopeptide (TPR) repeat protein